MPNYSMKAKTPEGAVVGEAAEWEDKGFKFALGAVKVRVQKTPGPIVIHVLMKDDEGLPHANQPFEIRGPGVKIDGVTTAEGYVDAEIPPDASHAVLRVGEDRCSLVFKKREKLDTPLGLQQALQTLGFTCEPSGKIDEQTRAAVKQLQAREGMEATGEADDALRERIEKLLGTP